MTEETTTEEIPVPPRHLYEQGRVHGVYRNFADTVAHLYGAHTPGNFVGNRHSDYDLDAAARSVVVEAIHDGHTYYLFGNDRDVNLDAVVQDFRIAPTVPDAVSQDGTVIWREAGPNPLTTMAGAIQELEELKRQNQVLIGQLAARDTWIETHRTNAETLEEYKQKIRQVATEEAIAHDWCPEIDRVLARVGLTRLITRYTATVNIEVPMTVTRTDGMDIPSESELAEMLLGNDAISRAIRTHLNVDHEHKNLRFGEIEFEVSDVSENEEPEE